MNILFLDKDSKFFDLIYRDLLVIKITPFLQIFYIDNKINTEITEKDSLKNSYIINDFSKEKFIAFVKDNQNLPLIINTDNLKNVLELLIDILKQNSLLQNVKIILFSKNEYDSKFDDILKNNVFKFINFKNKNEFIEKIKITLNELELFENEKREFIRFSLKNLDVEIGFKNPISSRILTGKLINISFGGLSFKTFKNDSSFYLLKNKIVKNFKIFFTETPFLCDIKIIYVNENIFCGQFLKIEQKEFEKLLTFIKNFILINV